MKSEDKYSEKIRSVNELHEPRKNIEASIVVVTYKPDKEEFKEVIDSLDDQTVSNFEIIVIDNGSQWEVGKLLQDCENVSRYIVMKENVGLTMGRNIGAKLSRGEIVIFLDDDGIPREDFVEEHLKGHRRYDIVALRGKIIPRSDDIFSRLAPNYNLGEEPHPFRIDAEGNSSFNKEQLLDVGGFNEKIAGSGGHEGNEITYRLIKSGISKEKIIYYPDAVIYHDYISGFIKYVKKKVIRHEKQDDLLLELHPDFPEIWDWYDSTEKNFNIEPEEEIKVFLIELVSRVIEFLYSNLRKGKKDE